MIAGLSDEQALALRAYGENLGMAFQVMDDILDFTGSEEELGKPAGSDLMQGTLTLPALLLIERHPDDNPVERYFDDREDTESLRQALEMIRGSTVLDESIAVAHDFRDKALKALEAPVLDSIQSPTAAIAKKTLVDLAHWVTERRS